MSANRILTALGLIGILATSLACASAKEIKHTVVRHTTVVRHYRHRHHYKPSVHNRVNNAISEHGKMSHTTIVKHNHM